MLYLLWLLYSGVVGLLNVGLVWVVNRCVFSLLVWCVNFIC